MGCFEKVDRYLRLELWGGAGTRDRSAGSQHINGLCILEPQSPAVGPAVLGRHDRSSQLNSASCVYRTLCTWISPGPHYHSQNPHYT